MWLIRLALVIGLAAGAGMARADAPSGEEAVKVVEELEHARRHAMVSADEEALVRILADDVVYIHSNGLAQSRDELLAMLAKGDIGYVSFGTETIVYRAYGSTVVATGVQSIELTSSGRPLTSRSRYTVVYAAVRGEHRLVSYQSTPTPEVVRQQTPGERKSP
jgi:ketosteroid isomerase-like protein